MTRSRTLTTAITLALVAATTGSAQGHATAASARSHGPRPAACVGAWQLSIYEQPGEAPLRALVQVDADYSVIYGETAAISSLTPGVAVEYTSPGIGRWTGSGRSCAYRLLVNAADVTGTYTRTSDIRGTLRVARNGRTFAGPLTITVTHADGSRNAFPTRATAKRISVVRGHSQQR